MQFTVKNVQILTVESFWCRFSGISTINCLLLLLLVSNFVCVVSYVIVRICV